MNLLLLGSEMVKQQTCISQLYQTYNDIKKCYGQCNGLQTFIIFQGIVSSTDNSFVSV